MAGRLNGDLAVPVVSDFIGFVINAIVHSLNGMMLPHSFKHLLENFESKVHWYSILCLCFTNSYNTTVSVKVAACCLKVIEDLELKNMPEFAKVIPILKKEYLGFQSFYMTKFQ